MATEEVEVEVEVPTSKWDVAIDSFAAVNVNSTLKRLGNDFTISVLPRNILIKPKKCCACASFDWPLEKVKEMKVLITDYAQPSMYLCVSSAKGPLAYKFFFRAEDKEAAANACYGLIDSYIEAMGDFINASPAWAAYIGKVMSPAIAVPAAPAPDPPAALANGHAKEELEAEVEAAPEPVAAVPMAEGTLSYKVTTDHYAAVGDHTGLNKLGSDFTLLVHPRELEFKARKLCGGRLNYKIEQVKKVEVLTSEFSEPSLLIVAARADQEVSHKLWVAGGLEAIEECKQGILARIEAMCTELGGAPAWFRLAPMQAAPVKKSGVTTVKNTLRSSLGAQMNQSPGRRPPQYQY